MSLLNKANDSRQSVNDYSISKNSSSKAKKNLHNSTLSNKHKKEIPYSHCIYFIDYNPSIMLNVKISRIYLLLLYLQQFLLILL